MAWHNLPVTTGTDISEFAFVNQFHLALQERNWSIGRCISPESSAIWYSGSITAITATSLTDANANPDESGTPQGWCYPDHPSEGDTYTVPWNCSTVDNPLAPTAWTLVIDDDPPQDGNRPHPMRAIQRRITSWDNFHLYFADISDAVSSGWVSSLSSLVGKRYYIIRYPDSLFWQDRILETPNDYEFARGVVDAATSTSLTAKGFKTGEHVGRDLLVRDSSGKLRRVAITANTPKVLTFAAQTWTSGIGNPFSIVASGGRAYPGRKPTHPFTAHRGVIDGQYRGHHPASFGDTSSPALGDYVRGISVPALTYCVPDAVLGGCGVTCPEVYDFDFHTSPTPSDEQLACGYPIDKFISPDYWKSFRAIQAGIEQICPYFVDLSRVPIAYAPATMFLRAGINTVTSIIDSVDETGIYFDIELPYQGIEVAYCLIDAKNRPYAQSVASLSTGFIGGTFDATRDVGRTIVIAFGWSRFVPRKVERMFYGATCFMPDIATDDDGNETAIDPPATNFDADGCNGVGQWLHRPVSTKYLEAGRQGPIEIDDFSEGEYARYVGNQWCDPITPATAATINYADLFYVGQFEPAVESRRAAQLVGKVTASKTPPSSKWLSDTSKDWWDNQWTPTQPGMHVEAGMGGVGSSTTTLIDSSKASGEPNCWWASTRFADGPYVGFTIEFLTSGTDWDDAAATIEKRIITSGDDTAVSVQWIGALSSTSYNKPYRIREPKSYELNRFEGRKLVVTDADGIEHTTTISGNDDTTLFFLPLSFPVVEGMRYRIVEEKTGGVYKRTGDGWQPVEGSDAVRIGVPTPADFVKFSPGNLPTYKRRFGKVLPGDALGSEFFNELQAAFDVLKWTQGVLTWTNKPSATDPEEPNQKADGAGTMKYPVDASVPSDFDAFVTDIIDPLWDADDLTNGTGYGPPDGIPDNLSTDAGPPTAYVGVGQGHGPYQCFSYSELRRYAYPMTGGHCRMTATYEFWTFGDVAPYSAGDDGDNAYFDGYNSDTKNNEVVFNNFGDPISYRVWQLADSLTVGPNSGDVYGERIGLSTLDRPPILYPDTPLDTEARAYRTEGYRIADQYVVKKWDVDGGYEFIS